MVPKNSKPGVVWSRSARATSPTPPFNTHTLTIPCWSRRRCQHLSGSLASTLPAGSHAQWGAWGNTPGCWHGLLLVSGSLLNWEAKYIYYQRTVYGAYYTICELPAWCALTNLNITYNIHSHEWDAEKKKSIKHLLIKELREDGCHGMGFSGFVISCFIL